MKNQKTLYILRHAKAETGAAGQEDHTRALIKRGGEAAEHMGKYMAGQGIAPDLVLCSTATRARQTWAQAEKAYKKTPQVEYIDKLYLASANEIINLLAAVPESVHSLLVVGHNPGLHQLALKFGRTGDEDLLDTLALKFPTCALATIALANPWREIGKARGVLKNFVTPKIIYINLVYARPYIDGECI
jgi:phosphohistidine phosphatase